MRLKSNLVLVLIILIIGFGQNNVLVSGHELGLVLTSVEAENMPTIDGTINTEEWTNQVLNTSFNYDTQALTVYMQNDATNLYLAIKLTNEDYNTTDSYDKLEIFFDGNHNGIRDDLEDIKVFDELEYEDWSYSTQGYTSGDFSKGGKGAATHSNMDIGTYQYELLIPLNSGDEKDISVSAGDTLGFAISFSEYTVAQNGVSFGTVIDYWPSGLIESDCSTYGDLVLVESNITREPEDTRNPNNTDDGFLPFQITAFLLLIPIIAKMKKQKFV